MQFPRYLLVAILCIVPTACGGSDASSDGSEGAPESVTGIVTEIESEGLNEVTSFELKDGDDVYEILIDDDANYGFPLGHLEEHRVGALPVKVEIEEREGDLYAQAIEDA